MKKLLIASGLAALMLFGAAYVYAQGAPGPGPGHRGMGYHGSWGHGKDNPLTPEQKTKFQDLRRKFTQENAQLIGAMVAKRLELRSLWTDSKADSNTILQKEKEFTGLRDQMREKVVQMKLEACTFLTPEQISHLGQRWGKGRGRMMGDHPMRGPGSERGHGYGMGRGGMGPGHGVCY